MPIFAIKYKAYEQSHEQQLLTEQLAVAAEIYNHCIKLHRRYYNIFDKFLGSAKLQAHLTKLKILDKYSHWFNLGSQAIQDVAQRIDKAYKLFFQEKKNGNTKIKPPGLKTSKSYKSFTLKQQKAGYEFLDDASKKRGIVQINKTNYKFIKHRQLEGEVKTLTIKRDSLGDWWFVASCEIEQYPKKLSLSGTTVGCDFGLPAFLTQSNGKAIHAPQIFKQYLTIIKELNRTRFSEDSSSEDVARATYQLARTYKCIDDKRRDWHFKLARRLVKKYDIICFETLDLESMKATWGRKVSDYGFAEFVRIICHMANKLGKRVICIDQYFPSTKKCSACGYILPAALDLKIREWDCPDCGVHHQRDENAATNIHVEGLRIARSEDLAVKTAKRAKRKRAGASAHGMKDGCFSRSHI